MDRFDHHCQWLNTCVGIGNHSIYYFYLLTIWFYIIAINIVCFSNLKFTITAKQIEEAKESGIFMQGDPTAGSAFFMYITSLLLVLVTANFCFAYLTYIVVV